MDSYDNMPMRLRVIRGKGGTLREIRGVVRFYDGTVREVSISPESNDPVQAKAAALKVMNKIILTGLCLRALRNRAEYLRGAITDLRRKCDVLEVREDPIFDDVLRELRQASTEALTITRWIGGGKGGRRSALDALNMLRKLDKPTRR